jgi:hypothetical protein
MPVSSCMPGSQLPEKQVLANILFTESSNGVSK